MKRYIIVLCLMMSTLFATSQKVTLRFTGIDLGGSYYPFDSVVVTNVNRGWTETLEFPDTTIVLSRLGVDEYVSGREGVLNLFPNPFSDFTDVDFAIAEDGKVVVSVVGIDGVQIVAWEGFLRSGFHRVRIALDKPQMALVVITTNKGRYVGKILQIGHGVDNTIEMTGPSIASLEQTNRSATSERLDACGGFEPGDLFCCTGLGMTKEGEIVVSETVVQAVFVDETIALVFPIAPIPVETVYTIDSILKMDPGMVFHEDALVFGVVTADEQSGNLYKAAFIQDRATGKAIELYMNSSSRVRIGDSICVNLKGVTYAVYNGLPQLSNFDEDGHIFFLGAVDPIEPVETTIPEIIAGNHLAGLVKLSNVMFAEQNTFANPGSYGNRVLVDPSDFSHTIIVRTSNYADFAFDSLPQGVGSLIAIASVYGSTWQLIIRSASELEFNGVDPGGEDDVMTLPYFQSFANDFGTYSTYDVLGAQSWTIDYSTAKMAGFENNTNYANEDWLISSPVNFAGTDGISLTMTYIARYFCNLNSDITLQVSSDYQSGDPNEATWKQIPASWVMGSDWNTFAQTTVDLSEFAGQKVRVAVKYVSSDAKAGTIEVQSILIQEGALPPEPDVEVQSLPYSQSFASGFGTYLTKDVFGAQTWEIDYQTAKMTGYYFSHYYANEDWLISAPVDLSGVNGAKMTMSYIGRYFTNINQEVTVWVASDYVWDSDPATANWIQVPATLREGSDWFNFLTAEISLSQFVGGAVNVAVKYTSTDQNAGTIEIQSILIEEGGDGPTPPPGPGGEVQSMPYSQSFESEFGTYITKDVEGAQSWTIKYQSAWISGHEGGSSGSDYANEDWLISSPIKIEGVEHAKVVLNYAAKYNAPVPQDVTMLVSTNYAWDADPTRADWAVLMSDIENNSTGSAWTFTDKEASLDNYLGQTVTVAVKYTSTTAGARTIEIKNITIQEGETGDGPTPPPGPGDPEGSGTADDPYNVAAGIGLQSEEPTAWVQGYIVGSVKANNATVSSNDQVAWEAPFELATNVVIADDPGCREISQCLFVNLPVGKPLREQVNLLNNPDNLGKRLSVLGKLRPYFGQAGLRDSNGLEGDFVLEDPVSPIPPDSEGVVKGD